MQMLLIRDAVALPYSVVRFLEYFVQDDPRPDEIRRALRDERVYFFIRYLLLKHVGTVKRIHLSDPWVESKSIVMKLLNVETENGSYMVDGHVTIDLDLGTLMIDARVQAAPHSVSRGLEAQAA